jgi:(2Fe-2S) ferredoxin
VLDEVLPAVGIVFFEDDCGDLFGDERTETAHAVAGDEGHHVVLERDKIVRLHSLLIVSETRVHRTRNQRKIQSEEYREVAKFQHHVFICTNERDESAKRPSCARQGSEKLKGAFKDAVKEAGLKGKVRANELSCLDQCEHGPVVVVYPDAVWYGFVHVRDVEEIVNEHLVHGRPVKRLLLADTCLNTERCPHKPMTKGE